MSRPAWSDHDRDRIRVLAPHLHTFSSIEDFVDAFNLLADERRSIGSISVILSGLYQAGILSKEDCEAFRILRNKYLAEKRQEWRDSKQTTTPSPTSPTFIESPSNKLPTFISADGLEWTTVENAAKIARMTTRGIEQISKRGAIRRKKRSELIVNYGDAAKLRERWLYCLDDVKEYVEKRYKGNGAVSKVSVTNVIPTVSGTVSGPVQPSANPIKTINEPVSHRILALLESNKIDAKLALNLLEKL